MKTIKFLPVIAGIILLNLSAVAQSFVTNGLVAYYPFKGNVNDAAGTNNGTIYGGVALASDRFGSNNSAYTFNGVDGYIDVGNPVGNSPTNLTQTAWIKLISRENTAASGVNPVDVIISKRDTANVGSGWYTLAIEATGANTGAGEFIVDDDGYETLAVGTSKPPPNVWFFICGVKSNNTYKIYINGILEDTLADSHVVSSVEDMYLMHDGAWGTYCNGVLDDVRIYNRALSSNEVAQLYAIEAPGPKITSQPTNVTVNIGDTAYFSVTAAGIAPLSYQWFKDGVVLPNATNATLTVANVQPPRIGNYTVTVSDTNAGINSSIASLSISNINSGMWQGLVAYYPFNGNANDVEGTNNGAIYGGVALAPDRFGSNNSAYFFNGVDGYIDIGNPMGISPTSLTETAWIKIISRETASEPVSPLLDVLISKRESATVSGWPDLCAVASGTNSGAGTIAINADFYFNSCVGTTRPSTNAWVFICEVCSNANYQIYVNGTLQNSIVDSHALSSIDNMYLMHCGAFGSFCNGVLDDVRIYNRALSSNDVAQIYASEAPPVPPHAATGAATLAGAFVVGVTITDNGSGYTNTPSVRFIGGGGGGAQAFAVVSNGVVTAINVINAGNGYTNVPLVVVDPPFIPNPTFGISSVSFLAFNSLTVNSNYQLQQFQSSNWVNQASSFKATNSVYTQTVSGIVGSADYRLVLTPLPVQALATAQLANGFVIGATVTVRGSGYVTVPAVAIIANVGSNATAVARLNSAGSVTNVSIINAGMNYASPVTIQIDPPPVTAFSPAVSPGVRLDSSNLVPYYNYQIQSKPDLGVAWGNLSGVLFTPTNSTSSQFVYTTNNAAFFRLQLLP